MTRPTTTRRNFMKLAAGAVAAGVSAPYVVIGAEGKRRKAKEQPKEEAANDKLGVGAIGVGGRGSGIGHDAGGRGNMLACADVDREHAERFASRYDGRCEICTDYRKVLDRKDIDIVTIGTPDHWHSKIAIEAMLAGKDVYCEKPLTLTIDEGKKICQVVRETKRVFQVGTQQRSDGNFRFACELVRNGYIGEVKSVFAEPGGTSRECNLPAQPVPPGFDWNMWLGPAPWAPYHPDRCVDLWHWWNWRDYSGGLMTDRGAHDYDIVQWGLGMDGSGPVEVIPPDGKDHKMLTFRYANGVLLESSDGGWGSLNGRGALVTFKGTKGEVSVWRGGIETNPASLKDVKIGPNEIHLYESHNHEKNFMDCVRSRERTVADVAIGASSVIVCHIGNIARWEGRPLRWDPKTETFPGDEAANRHTWRPMREPWRLVG